MPKTYYTYHLYVNTSAIDYLRHVVYISTTYFVTRFGGRIVANRCHSHEQAAQLGAYKKNTYKYTHTYYIYLHNIYIYLYVHEVTTFITMTSLSEGV